VSVKMSALLYLPGLLVISFKRRGPASTILSVVKLAATQVIIASPFLREHPWAYARGAFDLGRVFLYKWTVNWRFLREQTFLDHRWALGLMVGHVTVLATFAWFRWCQFDGGAWPVLSRGWKRPLFPAALGPITPDCVHLLSPLIFALTIRQISRLSCSHRT
jgi:alpha-1,3-mannosyltransferase